MSGFRSLLLLTLLGGTVASAQPAFNMGQGLCFVNKDAALSKAVWGLGALARKKGACQGMSAIVAAFLERVEFVPGARRLDADLVEDQIKGIMKDYRRGCSLRKVRITGYNNLNELCGAHREFFLEQSIWNNADIAVREIRGQLLDFLAHRDLPVTERSDQYEMAATLRRFRHWLQIGRKPLLLVFSHVQTVLAVQDTKSAAGTPQVVLWLYDPNTNNLSRHEVNLDSGRVPSRGQRKFWDVTPNRGC